MITTSQLEKALAKHLDGTPRFLVSAEVRPGGKVVVEVDNDTAITLTELTAINKALREEFGEALDDVELQVGSPGLGRPFRVERQYRKHVGRTVEVALVEGPTLQGVLEAFDGAAITLRVLQPSKVKGRPPKPSPETLSIPLNTVKSAQAVINLN